MFTRDAFKQVVKGSGLTKIEVAHLYGVSRQTVYDWLAGAEPHADSVLERRADTITVALLASIKKGVLPLAAVDRTVRTARVAKMRDVLQNLKLAPR